MADHPLGNRKPANAVGRPVKSPLGGRKPKNAVGRPVRQRDIDAARKAKNAQRTERPKKKETTVGDILDT